MKAITVRQPWAWAIMHGGKDTENRTRNIAGSYRSASGFAPIVDAWYALARGSIARLPAMLDAAAERDALAAKVERLVAVHARYFDLDGRPGCDDTNPAPEDVWRFDRDFRAALDEEAQP